MTSPRIALLASPTEDAQEALALLAARHGQHAPEEADVLVALGGDGFMLQTLHRHGDMRKPVYGMKLGSVGFLMNHYRGGRVARAHRGGRTRGAAAAGDAGADRIRGQCRVARVQRGLAAATDAPGRAPGDRPQRQAAAGRTDLRRRHGRHGRRQHRLQLFRAWSDPAAGFERHRADADRRLPAAPLARRAAQVRHRSPLPRARSRTSVP